MLGYDESRQSGTESYFDYIDLVANKIILTPRVQQCLEAKGLTDARHSDERRAPRFRCHGEGIVLPFPSNTSEIFEQEASLAIITNLSRTGIGLLSHDQWFPTQQVRVLTIKANIDAVVVRCKYLGVQCYEIGVRIQKFDELNPGR